MPDPVTAAAPEAVTPATSADATPPAQSAQRSDEPLLNKQEVVDLRKEVRSVEKMLKEQILPVLGQLNKPAEPAKEKPQPAQTADAALSEIAVLRRELELKDVFADLGVRSPQARDLIAKAAKADNPSNLREYVEKYAAAFQQAQPAAPAATPAAPPAQPAGKSDTGAPGTDGRSSLPDDPRLIDAAIWKGMDRKDRMSRYEAMLSRRGIGGNPWVKK